MPSFKPLSALNKWPTVPKDVCGKQGPLKHPSYSLVFEFQI